MALLTTRSVVVMLDERHLKTRGNGQRSAGLHRSASQRNPIEHEKPLNKGHSNLRRTESQRLPADHDKHMNSYSTVPDRKITFKKKINRRISAPPQRPNLLSVPAVYYDGSNKRRYVILATNVTNSPSVFVAFTLACAFWRKVKRLNFIYFSLFYFILILTTYVCRLYL